MNLSITLDTEQTAALDELLAAYNVNRDAPVSAVVYLETVLTGIINDKVQRKFDAAAAELVSMAKSAPYEARLALMADLKSKLV